MNKYKDPPASKEANICLALYFSPNITLSTINRAKKCSICQIMLITPNEPYSKILKANTPEREYNTKPVAS